jgi:xanthine/uracil permease
MDEPPAPPRRRGSDRALGLACVGVLAALAVVCALWSVVLLPPVVHSSVVARIGASLVLAGPGLYYMTLYAGRAAASRIAAVIPAAAWLVTVVLISAGRPEGDSAYLLSSYQGIVLAPLGMVAAALGVAHAGRRPWPVDGLRQPAPPPAEDHVSSI